MPSELEPKIQCGQVSKPLPHFSGAVADSMLDRPRSFGYQKRFLKILKNIVGFHASLTAPSFSVTPDHLPESPIHNSPLSISQNKKKERSFLFPWSGLSSAVSEPRLRALPVTPEPPLPFRLPPRKIKRSLSFGPSRRFQKASFSHFPPEKSLACAHESHSRRGFHV